MYVKNFYCGFFVDVIIPRDIGIQEVCGLRHEEKECPPTHTIHPLKKHP